MKVKTLIKELSRFNPEDIVVLSIDEEGNGFEELHDIEPMVYLADENEVKYRELTPAMIKQGYSEEDVYDGFGGEMAIVLWP